MAINKVHLLAALCSLVILTTFIGSTQSASCCLRYTRRRLQCQRIVGYTIQTINTSCDIDAIIFHMPGRFVCADPAASWTKKAMTCVDDRVRKTSQVTKQGTPGNATPA